MLVFQIGILKYQMCCSCRSTRSKIAVKMQLLRKMHLIPPKTRGTVFNVSTLLRTDCEIVISEHTVI